MTGRTAAHPSAQAQGLACGRYSCLLCHAAHRAPCKPWGLQKAPTPASPLRPIAYHPVPPPPKGPTSSVQQRTDSVWWFLSEQKLPFFPSTTWLLKPRSRSQQVDPAGLQHGQPTPTRSCRQSCTRRGGGHLPSPEGPAKAVLDQLAEDFLTFLQLEVLATRCLLCLKDLPTQRMLLKGGEPTTGFSVQQTVLRPEKLVLSRAFLFNPLAYKLASQGVGDM